MLPAIDNQNTATLKYGAISRLTTALAMTGFLLLSSCDKFVQIPPPKSSLTTSQIFTDSLNAAAAVSGIYSNILYGSGGVDFCNGAQTTYLGLSSDELINFQDNDATQFYQNALQSTNGSLSAFFWNNPYNRIYAMNAVIENLTNSAALSTAARNQFVGESKFLRSLFYFYLVNIFGDVPYITSTSWVYTDTARRVSKDLINQILIQDLLDAQNKLPADYSYSNGEKTRANKWAAKALLARIYLYVGDWDHAKIESDSVINSGQFSLATDLTTVFLANSSESILQWGLNTAYGTYNSTAEGFSILPVDSTQAPQFYLSPQLLTSFEPGDQRFVAWVDSSNYAGVVYYYPFKYKVGIAQQLINSAPTEYYTVLRLAEQYLIRAESEAHRGELDQAISDLDVIRGRAQLLPLSPVLPQADVLNAIAQERRIELFAEWGHRWLDLKRTAMVDQVMSVVTPQKSGGQPWVTTQQLFPIPKSELSKNPYLKQNAGYP